MHPYGLQLSGVGSGFKGMPKADLPYGVRDAARGGSWRHPQDRHQAAWRDFLHFINPACLRSIQNGRAKRFLVRKVRVFLVDL